MRSLSADVKMPNVGDWIFAILVDNSIIYGQVNKNENDELIINDEDYGVVELFSNVLHWSQHPILGNVFAANKELKDTNQFESKKWYVVADYLPSRGKYVLVNTEKGRKTVAKLIRAKTGNFNYWKLDFGKPKPLEYFFEWSEFQ
jgi:hypothetical protein